MVRHEKMGLTLLLLMSLGLWNLVLGKRIKDGIYINLNERGFCFRHTNGSHQMGCSSDLNGNVGVVHLISSESDRTWLIEKGDHEPYIAMITPKMFTKNTLKMLKSSGKINGVLLPDSYTHLTLPTTPYV